MSTMPRLNRPGPQRRCPPCPACGADAMRQYGAKHHGVVHRYFYACQACQHIDVWREVNDGAKRWERLRVPLSVPRFEQCRLELTKVEDKEYRLAHEIQHGKGVSEMEPANNPYEQLFQAWQTSGMEGVKNAARNLPAVGDISVIVNAFAAASQLRGQTHD